MRCWSLWGFGILGFASAMPGAKNIRSNSLRKSKATLIKCFQPNSLENILYLKEAKLRSYGPIDNLNVSTELDINSNPTPVVLIGKNGSGKSTLLACLLNTIVELKGRLFGPIPEVEHGKRLVLSSQTFIKSGSQYSVSEITFSANDSFAKLIELVSIDPSQFPTKAERKSLTGINWSHKRFNKHGFFSNLNLSSEDFLDELNKNVILFFPVNRFEEPAWLNKSHTTSFKVDRKYIDQADNNLIKVSVVNEIRPWLLDIVMDSKLYDEVIIPGVLNDENFPANEIGFVHFQNNPTTRLKNAVNQILTLFYRSKDSNVESSRIGITDRKSRSICIYTKLRSEDKETLVAPSLSHLSSGELMVLGFAFSILKEADRLNLHLGSKLEDIPGIVLIDEIDLHLNFQIQHNLLPKVLKLFPKIQFVFTTHSPSFLTGLEKEYPDIRAISLPGGELVPVTEFSEVQDAISTFYESFEDFKSKYDVVRSSLGEIKKPLVITEGKTDWKHLKNAYCQLNDIEEIQKFSFLEFETTDMGDTELLAICKSLSKVNNPRKVICIFDCDNSAITQLHTGEDKFKSWGNNVYSFCLDKPEFRANHEFLSIEFLYTDEDLEKTTSEGKRLIFTNEVQKVIIEDQVRKDKSIEFKIIAPKPENYYLRKVFDKDIAKVVDADGNQIGMSKSLFSEQILNKEGKFKTVSFEGFVKTFQLLEEILEL